MEYASMTSPLCNIAASLHIEALEVSMKELVKMKENMQELKLVAENTLICSTSDGKRYVTGG